MAIEPVGAIPHILEGGFRSGEPGEHDAGGGAGGHEDLPAGGEAHGEGRDGRDGRDASGRFATRSDTVRVTGSMWPIAYAMDRLRTRYGPSKDDPHVMIDYEHAGGNRFVIANDRAYPVRTEEGSTSLYDPLHPDRPAWRVSHGTDGQWQIRLGLAGGGGDPDRSVLPHNRDHMNPQYPPPPQNQQALAADRSPRRNWNNVLALGAPAPGNPAGINLQQYLQGNAQGALGGAPGGAPGHSPLPGPSSARDR